MPDTATFDWRGYGERRGLHPMHTWLAVRNSWPSNSSWNRPVSPMQLDRLCDDETMHDVIRAAIDEAA